MYSEIHKLMKSVWYYKELPQQWKESIAVPIIWWTIKEIVVTVGRMSLL
jgi:hypothetical protein